MHPFGYMYQNTSHINIQALCLKYNKAIIIPESTLVVVVAEIAKAIVVNDIAGTVDVYMK